MKLHFIQPHNNIAYVKIIIKQASSFLA